MNKLPPSGYRFAAVACGVKPGTDRSDLALLWSDRPAAAAGVFTQNRVVAAPVQVSRTRVPGTARGIVVCAGNANACTGDQGLRDAERMADLAGQLLGVDSKQVLVASTGVIGRPLPMVNVESGIARAAEALSPDAAADVARAILTTDTVPKTAARPVGDATLFGIAKGAAMIGPNLATMLGFVLTDAAVRPADLQAALLRAAERSFNCVSVEGHTSTNDTVFALANGAGPPLEEEALAHFGHELELLCQDLARQIARDAEGASHFVTIHVEGLPSDLHARQVAKAVADSPLVKAAIYGADPNWGRIVSAAGYAGVPFEEHQLSLWLGDLPLYRDGQPLPFPADTAAAYLRANRDVELRLRFSVGTGRCTFWTCDLTPEYVRLNADYTT